LKGKLAKGKGKSWVHTERGKRGIAGQNDSQEINIGVKRGGGRIKFREL